MPRSRSSFGTESNMISGWSLWRTFHSATGQGRSGSLQRLLAGAHMFLKLPMQLMPKSCPCGRLGVGCKVKTVYKFCASFSAFCKCFKQAPILYNLIKVLEDSQLPHPGLRQELGVQAPVSCHGLMSQPREKKSLSEVAQDLVSRYMPPRPPDPSLELLLPTPQSLT